MAASTVHNEYFTLHRNGPFDRQVSQARLDYLTRHEIRRTAFVDHNGAIRTVVDPEARIELQFADLGHFAEQVITRICHRPGDRSAPGWWDVSVYP